jgi:hypothetical protein
MKKFNPSGKQGVFAMLLLTIFILQSCSSHHGITSTARLRDSSHHLMMTRAKGNHQPVIAKSNAEKAPADATATTPEPAGKTPARKLIAQLTGDAPMQATVPERAIHGMDDDKMGKVNEVLAKYSNHKVSISKTSGGKVVLKADSRKQFFKLVKTLAAIKKSSAPIDDNTRNILGLVGGICGIVAIGLCAFPFVDFISIPAGVGGIVLGALGLHSDRRHKMALLGIILGSVGLLLAIITIVLYAIFLGFGVAGGYGYGYGI